MKAAVLALFAALLVGCSSTEQSDLCARMEKAYTLYQISLQSGREISKEEAQAAAIAAAYLALNCGWTQAKSSPDSRGVMVVIPPTIQ